MSLTRYGIHQGLDGTIEVYQSVNGEYVKADDVRAVLAAYIQHGERLLADVIGTSESAESFRYWIEKLKQEIAND